jgi:hypothetical protein
VNAAFECVEPVWRSKEAECSPGVKYWEVIADNLSKAGWSWGCVAAIDSNGRTIFIADAHRDDGKRFVAHADEKLTAFLERETAIRHCSTCQKMLLTLSDGAWQNGARAKSVGRLPQELHLTLFPQR